MATCLRCMPFQFLRMAGALIFEILRVRPWRTSWLIVGTKTLLLWSVRSDGGPGSPAVGRFASGQARGILMGWTDIWGGRRARRPRTPAEATKAECSSGRKMVSNTDRAPGDPDPRTNRAARGGRADGFGGGPCPASYQRPEPHDETVIQAR